MMVEREGIQWAAIWPGPAWLRSSHFCIALWHSISCVQEDVNCSHALWPESLSGGRSRIKDHYFSRGIRNLCNCWKHWLTKYILIMASTLLKVRMGKLLEIKICIYVWQLTVLKHCLCQQKRHGYDNYWRLSTRINLKQLYSRMSLLHECMTCVGASVGGIC